MKRKLGFVLPVISIVALAALPLLVDSRATLNLFNYIFILSIFAMSYNLLLGYTGIVSFGHALFFGSGAYIMGLALKNGGPDLFSVFIGVTAALIFGLVVALVIGILSLRVRDVYFAMITLAFGELFFIGAIKLRDLTGGEDGFSFSAPSILQDRVFFYYLTLLLFIATFYIMRIFVSSPTGMVLQAIRENEQRAAALGYDVFRYKLFSTVVAGVLASLAGVFYGLQQRFVSASVLGLEKTMDALLMTIVGGSGTLYGPILGAALVSFVKEWFTSLARTQPIFERWLILFGILYILIVLFFPGGLARTFSQLMERKRVRPGIDQVKLNCTPGDSLSPSAPGGSPDCSTLKKP